MSLIVLFGVFLALLIAGTAIPFAIGIAALISLYMQGGLMSFNALGLISWGSMDNFSLTAVPLFVLMAEIVMQSGLSHRVYRGMYTLVRHLPGGLLQTNIAGCGVFAAISGSSVATAAAISAVALPHLKERGYNQRLALGTLAAGGTLGILIPPSVAMIIYGTFTQTSIAKLFIAGVIPGIVLVLLFMVYVALLAWIRPQWVREAAAAQTTTVKPEEESAELDMGSGSMLGAANDLLPFAILIAFVVGSLYFGWATPTEAGAIGAVGATVIAYIWSPHGFRSLWPALVSSAQITGAVLFIVYAAFLFSYAINLSGFPGEAATWLVGQELSRLEFLIALFVLYIIMGCIMDSLAMIVITIPLLQPVLMAYGIDLIWFGVALVLLIELGLITPPLGLNLFVLQSISKGKLSDVIWGTAPFCVIVLIMLALLTVWPDLALYLPSTLE
ncbi:TRAP transporter large permease [Minwuia thermotolerans]|uniref:TRAP transporter large permease n=1 Tax=Minwuia thermotolerans TaxID=2056226 RepID=UPI000D6DC380|nr:TRAP transporter large permease [Minwuia thermotolerans]